MSSRRTTRVDSSPSNASTIPWTTVRFGYLNAPCGLFVTSNVSRTRVTRLTLVTALMASSELTRVTRSCGRCRASSSAQHTPATPAPTTTRCHASSSSLVVVVVHSCVGTVGTLLGVERTADGPAEYRPIIARVRVVAGFGRGRGADVGARHHREIRASTQPPRATNPAHATLREHRRPPFWMGHADGSE